MLGDPTCLESSGSTTFPTLIMAVAHDFLNLYGDETSAPLTPWRKCGIFVVKSFTGGEDESNRVLEQISPFLNQYLIHLTIESRFDELSPAQDTRIAKLLALSHNRASILLATLDIEQRLAQRLRSFWVEEAEKGRARWLKGNTGD